MVQSGEIECSDVIKSDLHDVSWVQQELGCVDLCDKRLDRRLIKTTEKLAASPLSPINEACGDWASTQAAYRFFDNTHVTSASILKPHIHETAKRMAAYGGPVLVVQDTVFFSYGKHPNTRGLGPIGKSNSSKERGLIMHNALAFTTSGVALGLLSQSIWARKDVPDETPLEKIERLQCTPLDEKESVKWLKALRETVANTPPGVQVITIADRESDIFECIAEAERLHTLFLLRSRTDRLLIPEESEGHERIGKALEAAPVLGTVTVKIPGNGKRKERVAIVEVKSTSVTIRPPVRRGDAKKPSSVALNPITLTIVSATEISPPEGIEAISWTLLTNIPVKDFDEASRMLDWYGKRWGIEIWHKVLKSGCKVESCLLETADRLKRFLTLFSIIGVRLMHITCLARVTPDAPSTEVFSREEMDTLHIRVKKTIPPEEPPTLQAAVQMIGSLGGHLGRKCDGTPGATVLWRGLMRLHESVEALRAYKTITNFESG